MGGDNVMQCYNLKNHAQAFGKVTKALGLLLVVAIKKNSKRVTKIPSLL